MSRVENVSMGPVTNIGHYSSAISTKERHGHILVEICGFSSSKQVGLRKCEEAVEEIDLLSPVGRRFGHPGPRRPTGAVPVLVLSLYY